MMTWSMSSALWPAAAKWLARRPVVGGPLSAKPVSISTREIFEEFTQVPSPLQRKVKGTGTSYLDPKTLRPSRYTEDAVEDGIKRHIGRSVGSVSRKTSYVVAGDSPRTLERVASLYFINSLGAVFGCCIVAMCVGVREPPAPAAPAAAGANGRGLPRQFMTPPILWAIAMFVCAAITFNPFNTFYQFFAHASAVPKATLGMLTAIGYAVSIASAFAIGWLVDRCGAMRISAIVIGAYCVVAALGVLPRSRKKYSAEAGSPVKVRQCSSCRAMTFSAVSPATPTSVHFVLMAEPPSWQRPLLLEELPTWHPYRPLPTTWRRCRCRGSSPRGTAARSS